MFLKITLPGSNIIIKDSFYFVRPKYTLVCLLKICIYNFIFICIKLLCHCLLVHKWLNLLKCVMFTINIEKVMNLLQFIQMLHVSFVIDSRFWSSLSSHQLWRCLCKSSSCILCGPLVIDSVTLGPFRITGLIFILYFFTYLATNFQVYYYLCLCLASGRQSILMSCTSVL